MKIIYPGISIPGISGMKKKQIKGGSPAFCIKGSKYWQFISIDLKKVVKEPDKGNLRHLLFKHDSKFLS